MKPRSTFQGCPPLLPVLVRAALALALAGAVARTAESDFPSGPTALSPYVTYFPPSPPVYGAPVAEPEPSTAYVRFNGKPLTTPDELADFVGETFYAALGSRLFGKSLTRKIEARLEAYRTNRAALRNELEDKLVEVQNADPAARERQLQEFARQQTPRVATLEREAERLRHDLVRGDFFNASNDINFSRGWRLGDAIVATGPLQKEAEFQVARGTAFLEDGLGIEQRGLLRELAIDLAREARATRRRPATAPATGELTAMFFSPETARLQLPAKLPPELVAKIGRFNGEKTALKQELFEALNQLDKASDSKRTRGYAKLTEKQWPGIASLEKQAEEIRTAFAALADPPPPRLPPIEAGLRRRIESYSQERNALVAAYTGSQNRARGQMPFPSDFFRLSPAERERKMRDRAEGQLEARRLAENEFKQQNAEQIDSLQKRYELIRAELAETARDLRDSRTGQPMTVESLLFAYRVAMQRFDEIGREEVIYSRYKIAMLQPGLSPEQRRLLFGTAHAGLAQALPAGELSISVSSRPTTRS